MQSKQIKLIEEYIESFGTKKYNSKNYRKYFKKCFQLKKQYIISVKEELSKKCLLYESVIRIQYNYLKLYKLILKDKHENAWSYIIDIENELNLIKPYLFEDFSKYKLDSIEDKITKIQTLFPYKLFFSAGYTVENYKCSICGKTITLRNRCEHKKGNIYNGRWCYWIKQNIINFDHVAVVFNPKNKKCIPTNINGERLDFSLVNELVTHLHKPYLNWDLKWTKIRHPHDFFKDVKGTDNCPCDSGLLYKDCCLKEHGVLRPHVEFDLGKGFCDNPNAIKYLYTTKNEKISDNKKSHMESIIMTTQ